MNKRQFEKKSPVLIRRAFYNSKHSIIVGLSAFAIVVSVVSCAFFEQPSKIGSHQFKSNQLSSTHSALIQNYAQLPLRFEKNQGQVGKRVRYLSHSAGYKLLLTDTETVLALHGSHQKQVEVVRTSLVNAKTPLTFQGQKELSGKVNYLTGRDSSDWITKISTYADVIAKEVYPGIDLRYHGDQQQLEYDFIVSPGAQTDSIGLSFKGIEQLTLNEAGDLVLHTKHGMVKHKKPVIYQEIKGERIDIEGQYAIHPADKQFISKYLPTVGFNVAAYNTDYPLIIDPVLDYSTYLGGDADDQGLAIAVDAGGSAYVAGKTVSTEFPAANFYQDDLDNRSTFIAKLSPAGDELIYLTYFGGEGERLPEMEEEDEEDEDAENLGLDIAVDSTGHLYLTGTTGSKTGFPIVNAIQANYGGGASDAYIAKFSPGGDNLIFSTYLGGRKKDRGVAIALDLNADIYITGTTQSKDFPVISAVQAKKSGGKDAYIAKLSSDGRSLNYSTFIGGNKADIAAAIVVDSYGNATITGQTKSKKDFPLHNALQESLGGNLDAFITQLSSDGNVINYSTYLGGRKKDEGRGIAVDSQGNVFVVGVTNSKKDFPLADALQGKYGGGNEDGFISKLTGNGGMLAFSTYLGGNKSDKLNSAAVDNTDKLFVFGSTKSPHGLPVTEAIQDHLSGSKRDAYIAQLSNDGSQVTFASYFGGDEDDRGRDIAINNQSAYLTGITQSGLNFPVYNALQALFGGGMQDAFIAKIGPDNLPPEIISTPVTSAIVGQEYSYQVEATDPDNDNLQYSLETFPTGMSIAEDTGEISWIPVDGGSYNITVVADDGKGGVAEQSYAITAIIPDITPPNIILTNPITTEPVTNQSLFTITGTLSESANLAFNNVSVPVNADLSFTIGPLSLFEGLNSFTLSAVDSAGNVTTQIINVTLDTVAPILTVDTPQDSSLTNQAEVFFGGKISEPAELSIQGQAVIPEADNTFAATITLAEGLNNVEIIATDKAGNVDSANLNITVDTTAPVLNIGLVNRGNPQNRIVMVTGLPGAAEPGSLVHVINPKDGFEARVLVQSDGSFSTDVSGYANDSFQLFVEDAALNRSATETLAPSTPLSLTLDPIGDKIAPLGQITRFTVTANDSQGNPVTLGLTPLPLPAGMDYNIKTGEFSFRPSNGQEGNYTLTFSGLSDDEKVTETINLTVPAPSPIDPTVLTGRVLDASGMQTGTIVPIVGATISFLGTGVSTTTDVEGYFTLTGLPDYAEVFDVDTSTAQPGPGGTAYAGFREQYPLALNVVNLVERPFYMPRLDSDSLTTVDPSQTTVVDNPNLGITLTVAPNNAINDADGTPYSGQISISEVPRHLAPANLPAIIDPKLLFTIQPVGISYSSPAPLTVMNTEGYAPNSEVDIWSVDPDLGRFVIVGVGKVTADGSKIETISGGIRANDWHALLSSDPANGGSGTNTNNPCPVCPSEAGASMFSLNDGHMGVNFSLPSYRSLEASRSLSFNYHSFRAYPQPSISLNSAINVRSTVPDTVSYELDVAGLRQGREVFVDTSGFNESKTEPFSTAISFNASDFETGMYNYRFKITSNFSGGTRRTRVVDDEIMVVNEQQSPFGAGWMLEGLYKLAFNPQKSVTLIAPNGRSINYRPGTEPDSFISPNNDYATFVRNPDDGSYIHTEKDGVKMHFNADGQITKHEDRNHNITAYAYDADGKLLTLTDPVGLETSFAYNLNGLLETVTDPAGRVSHFNYDAAGNLIKIDYPDNTFKTFEYDARHLMIAHEDERKNRFTDRYDVFGRIIDGTLPDGTVRAAVGKTASALVDVSGGIGTQDNPAPVTRTDEVDGEYTDGRGNRSRKVLDAQGRATLEVDELGRVTSHERDADSNPIRTTRPIGSVVTRTFDNFGNVLTQKEEFNGATTTYSYDNFSLVTQVTNPRHHTTTINRDANGNPSSIVNHLLHTTSLEYDSRGLVTRNVSPNGLETVYTYNAQGLMTTKTETPPANSPGNIRIWHYSYYPTGLLKTVDTPDGITLNYSYDERSQLISVTDNLNQSVVYSYDEHKNVIKTETLSSDGSLALLIDSIYDNRNRLIETRAPHLQVNGETIEQSITQRLLDENSNLTGLIDPNGNPSGNSYDAYNRLENNTHRENGVTQYQYDKQDRIIKVTAPNGVVTEYEYDIISRRSKEISADRGTISYSYDLANNVTSITEGRGITTTLSYDELERVKTKTYPNTIAGKTEDVNYIYDTCLFGLGFLCERADESGNYAYSYDAYGNLVETTFTEIEGTVYSTGYQYDDGDHLIQMTLPSGRIIDYSRDGVRRLQAIDSTVNGNAQAIVSDIQYRGDNQMLSCRYGNGLTDQRSYDLQGRLQSQQLSNAANTIIDQRDYSYDKNSNILNITGSYENNQYQYDKLDRITQDGINTEIPNNFSYDQNDNRLTYHRQDLTRQEYYQYLQSEEQPASNRIHRIESIETGTEPVGNAGNRDLIYNDAGRLYQLIEGDLLKAEYIYNDQGQRTRKTVYNADGITVKQITVYHYDQAGQLITETTETGQLIKDYIWQEGLHPVAQIDNSTGTEQILYLYTDHLMTNRLATDQNQSIIWRWEGEAFGSTQPEELAGLSVNLRFPGQYFDSESGLFYNWNRYYDTNTGRYITSDPIGLKGGLNTYNYVYGNPILYADPFGLKVTGKWINNTPSFGQGNIDIHWSETEFISPEFDPWGYLKVLRFYGTVSGVLSTSVECTDDMSCPGTWEMHHSYPLSVSSHGDVGPNLYATGAGLLARNPWVTLGANVVLGLAKLGHVANQLNAKYGQIGGMMVNYLLTYGPDEICKKGFPALPILK